MYFLQGVDYVFQTKLSKSSFANTIQNAHMIFVSMSCGIGLLYSATYSYEAIPFITKLLLIQCSVDLFLTDKPDILIHNIVAINMAYLNIIQFDIHAVSVFYIMQLIRMKAFLTRFN